MKRYLIIFILFMSVILTISGCGKTYEFQLSPVDDSLTYASNNQIWYTSSDGNIVNPRYTDVFGAIILSNKYNNGKGVITFDSDVTTIGEEAFYGCYRLTSVNIPDSVTTIGYKAFTFCDSLTSVTIPDSVTSIESEAFQFCKSLTSVNIGDSVTSIGEEAFYGCNSLTSVTIGDSVTSIGESAFWDCYSLTSVNIPDSVTTIGESAFSSCSSLTEFKGKFAEDNGRILVIDGVLTAFAPVGLTEYTIPDSVTTIGEDAFYDCDSLTSVNIGDSVTTIGEEAFWGCYSLTSVNIPNSVTTIGEFAFASCDRLTSVTIPDSVTSIGDSAFNWCTSLTSVYCKATTPPALGSGAFKYWNGADFVPYGCDIYVPIGSVEAYKSATNWNEYASAIVGYDFENGEIVEVLPNNEIWYTSSDGDVVEPNKTNVFGAKIISNKYNNGMGVITFDGDVTSIGTLAFWGCLSLTSVNIPDSVTKIEYGAFSGCASLTSVNIPDSVTTIGSYAFGSCTRLTSVNIPDSVTTIGEWAFSLCENLTSITIPNSVTTFGSSAFAHCSSLTSVTIGDGVTTIGEKAFVYCISLTSVNIPDSVTTIGDSAFYDCTSLTSVYCKATTPPALGDTSVFDSNGSGRKIFVPAESVEAYKSAYGWSEYASAIVGYDF